MLKIWTYPRDRAEVEELLRRLRIDPSAVLTGAGELGEIERRVRELLRDVLERGDEALLEQTRRFDDPNMERSRLRVTAEEMESARRRLADTRPELLGAIRKAIEQVRGYQQHILPASAGPLRRAGMEASLRFTPVDSAGLYVPGGTASYPSSVIMLAVPAQVAGVKRVVVCTPGGAKLSDAVLATSAELGIGEMYRLGGATAIAAMALGTASITPVDVVLGPGNLYVQMAKRLLSGLVGTDGFAGPSEILVLADESADAETVAADLLAQAEHDPGSCFLLTASPAVAHAVASSVQRQAASLPRREALERSLSGLSAAVVCPDMESVYALANRIACEHVSLQVSDVETALAALRHAGCVFAGRDGPVAAGDYVAGPSHCLPTNTTARFASGVSVYSFLKRSSVVRYGMEGLAADGDAITTLARAEGLEAHARSVEMRLRRDESGRRAGM
ncbi:MAG: histidinol dehydrogenase [Tepidisphaerales bacterium]